MKYPFTISFETLKRGTGHIMTFPKSGLSNPYEFKLIIFNNDIIFIKKT